MKKLSLTFAATFFLMTNSFANELPNFQNIKEAIVAGKSIHIVTDFAKCSTNNRELPQAMSVGVYTPSSIAVMESSMATSLTHFTLNNPQYPSHAVNEFVRYEFLPDGSVNLSMQVLDAATYKVLSDKITFDCKLGAGMKVYS